jgi:hypothetical protein
MRDFDESISPSSRNAFTSEFLQSINERDEPLTGPEADVAGPWRVEPIPGAGWGLFRLGEEPAQQLAPFGIFRNREVALLFAAVLPGTGRDAAFRLRKEPEAGAYPIETTAGELAGHLGLFDETLIGAAHVVECLVRRPDCLAYLLESAGGLALERAGAILAARVRGNGPEPPFSPAVA